MTKACYVITGATGFIGQAVIARLRAKWQDAVQIVALDSSCNLEDPKATFERFQALSGSVRADHVLHFAARAPSGVWLAHHPADALYSNTLINANLFEACRRYFPDARVTTTLSYSMYPMGGLACTEEQVAFSHPDDNLAAYAGSKAAVLTAQRAYLQQYGLQAKSVVLPTVFGFNEKDGEHGQVIPALCKKFLDAAKADAPRVDLWGDGYQERDYLYVGDAADGILASTQKQESSLINLGSGQVHSIRDVAALIAQITGYRGDISYDTSQYSGPNRRWLNIDKASAELGWRPSTSLEDGLRRTLAKMQAHTADRINAE